MIPAKGYIKIEKYIKKTDDSGIYLPPEGSNEVIGILSDFDINSKNLNGLIGKKVIYRNPVATFDEDGKTYVFIREEDLVAHES